MTFGLLAQNLISPLVLAFVLGVVAVVSKSDLKIPDQIFSFLSLYLLLSLGLKGGVALSGMAFGDIWLPSLVCLGLGCLLPLLTFGVIRYGIRLSQVDAAAIAAHYGSVSVVTFMAAKVFLTNLGFHVSDLMTAMVALLEIPGIIVALLLAQGSLLQKKTSILMRIGKIIASKSIILLIGGLVMGALCGEEKYQAIAPFFSQLFQGILVLFLLDMGIMVGSRIHELRHIRLSLALCGIIIPLINGGLGSVIGLLVGLNLENAAILATLCASASYIAAPAAVRMALPGANPAYYVTLSLVITFPFNLTLGIPLYFKFAKMAQRILFP